MFDVSLCVYGSYPHGNILALSCCKTIFPFCSSQLMDKHSGGSSSQLCDHKATAESKSTYMSQGLAEAFKFVYNDAKFVNERAQNDILLLSRYIYKHNVVAFFFFLPELVSHPLSKDVQVLPMIVFWFL